MREKFYTDKYNILNLKNYTLDENHEIFVPTYIWHAFCFVKLQVMRNIQNNKQNETD